MKRKSNIPKKRKLRVRRLALKIVFYILLPLTLVTALRRIIKMKTSKQPSATSGRADTPQLRRVMSLMPRQPASGYSARKSSGAQEQKNKGNKITVKQDEDTETKRAGTMPKFLPVATALLSIAALILLWKIADYMLDEYRSIDFWDDLQNAVVIANEGEQDGEVEDGEAKAGEAEDKGMEIPESIDFDSLHEISGDAVAWLFSPGTKINYVIAQAKDNDYYLHRLLDGTTASGGTLFEDYRCSADLKDWNTLVYGHHMKNGSMFAGLMDYRDPAYYEEHPVMYLYIPGKRYKLELIAGYTTTVDDMIFSIPATKEGRDKILHHASRVSSFISGITADAKDKLVTLSTCSYAYDDARYVVIGRIVEETERPETNSNKEERRQEGSTY